MPPSLACACLAQNPVPVHIDHENYGVTALVIFALGARKLKGGSHVLFSNAHGSEGCAVIVKEHPWGVVLLGEYSNVLHASLAVECGERFVVTAYCGGPILRNLGALGDRSCVKRKRR